MIRILVRDSFPQKPVRWLSLLVYYTVFNDQLVETAHTLILADIKEPSVEVTDEKRRPWMLRIQGELYLGKATVYTIFIENRTLFDVYYRWEEFYGEDFNKIKVELEAYHGKVFKSSRKESKIRITPLEFGKVQEFYMPINVDGMSSIKSFRIMCDNIKSLMVIIR